MTIATFPGERWERADGAPMSGPSFDLHVPSSSDPDTVYRVVRDLVTEVIIHKPMCPAWKFGHHDCRHVKAAVKRAEQPAAAFLEVVGDAFDTTTWWAEGELPPMANDLIVTVKLALDEARAQIARNESAARAHAEADQRTAADAFRDLGGVS